ncbi:TraR/DksA C4-type zinc finger protein [Alteribacillus sp. HJP-4]|uniref:TraR/DksA C4-type zinc finger protein n=1 Tax=Alteribacillus sp. HJP-4 TaxID=2775394 RepID=UPI0035CD0ECD
MQAKSFFQDVKRKLVARKQNLQALREDRLGTRQEFAKESMGELSNADNHPGDQATELYEREKDIALDQHAGREEERVDKAIEAIDNGDYGRCRKCGNDIPLERLEAEPTALECIQHSYEEQGPEDEEERKSRPVEEEQILPGKGGFKEEQADEVDNDRWDAEEIWDQTEAYGSSDTPSDTYDPSAEYAGMFGDAEHEPDDADEYDGFSVTDSEGNPVENDADMGEYTRFFGKGK